jgi:hypothetical protein
MRNVQLMKKKKSIFRVYHIRIIAKKKVGSHDMKQTDSSIILVKECVRAYLVGCFVPMIVDHDLVKKSFSPMIADHDLVKKR